MGGQDLPTVKNYPLRANVPAELRESMGRTVAYALDFVLDTLDHAPDETLAPQNEAELRTQPTGDPAAAAGTDRYCVVIWNDDKHSFEEVILLLCDLTQRTVEDATEIANRIDDQGREIIDMSSSMARLLELSQAIAQIDLGVTVRRAYDTFREQVAAVIIEWLLDLTRSQLGADALIIREVIATELLSPRKNSEANKLLNDVHDPVRLDWMFIYHAKLWKKPRLNLKEVYASLLTLSHEHKLAVGEYHHQTHAHFDLSYG